MNTFKLSAIMLSLFFFFGCGNGSKHIYVDTLSMKITGGNLAAYSFINGTKGSLLDTKKTGASPIELSIKDSKNPILIELSGATFSDFSTDSTAVFKDSEVWSSIVIPASGNFDKRHPLPVNPLTTITAALASHKIWYSTDEGDAIDRSGKIINEHFAIDINRSFVPPDPDINADVDSESLKYYIIIGGLTKLVIDISAYTEEFSINDLLKALVEDISLDGIADGNGRFGHLSLGTYSLSRKTLSEDLVKAIEEFISDKNIEMTDDIQALIQSVANGDSDLFNLPGVSDFIDPNLLQVTPAPGSYLAGITELRIEAADESGISEMNVFLKGSDTIQLFDIDPSPEIFKTSLDTSAMYDGPFALKVAIVDKNGNYAEPIFAYWVDNTLPTISSNIPDIKSFRGNRSISINASDNSGIDNITLTLDSNILGTATRLNGAQYVYDLNTESPLIEDGEKVLAVEAIDLAGNVKRQDYKVVINNNILSKANYIQIGSNPIFKSADIEIRHIGDFNNDGLQDIFVGKTSTLAGPFLIWGNSSNNYSLIDAKNIFVLGAGKTFVANHCDLNGDVYPDFMIGVPSGIIPIMDSGLPIPHIGYVTVGYGPDRINAGGTLVNPKTLVETGYGEYIVCADINNDGLSEILLSTKQEKLKIFRGYDLSPLSSIKTLEGKLTNLKDINKDGYDEVLVGKDVYCPKNNRISTRLYGYNVLASDDIDSDGASEIIAVSDQPYSLMIFHNLYNDIEPYPSKIISPDFDITAIKSATTGDIDGDGNKDVIIGLPGNSAKGLVGAGQVVIFLGPDFKYTRIIESPTPEAYMYLGTYVSSGFDLNGDGRDDLMVKAPGADDTGSFYIFTD